MIAFTKVDNQILLQYTPERQENWIEEAVDKRMSITLKKTFTLWKQLLISKEEALNEEDDFPDFDEFGTSSFLFAVLTDEYYKVINGVLVDGFDIYIHREIPLIVDYFVADSNVSIFKVIGSVYKGDFYLGGENSNAISIEVFDSLLKYFPTSYERKKYVEARISSVLRNYLDNVKDGEKVYQKYLDKKLSNSGQNLTNTFNEYEIIKYQTILDKLQKMLGEENQYSEHQWQEEILQIILLLYPKYIFVFKEVPVHAQINEDRKEKRLDFLLVDSNGNTDIIEIKKPFENAIMTKGYCRDNYIPLRELSGTVMQIEKYIYYLNRWSYAGEKYLTEKYKENLPNGFDIKITNPNGIIIMGRENNLSIEQKRDFEVVKRKYKNIADVITYDDLLARLRMMIEQLKKV